MIKLGDYIIKPTIFPDGTSQVWKIPEQYLKETIVNWTFENESEIIHLCQLAELLNEKNKKRPYLFVQTMPYARQDKKVSNETTFSRDVVINILRNYFTEITTIDLHSLPPIGVRSLPPTEIILDIIQYNNFDLICFPDKGATTRGYPTGDLPSFNLDKKRDQLTGVIEGVYCPLPLNLTGKSILIVDDLCDGGGTFVQAATLLRSLGASSVNLYTTHGIYSRGVDYLLENGIDRIFNFNGEVQKTELVIN